MFIKNHLFHPSHLLDIAIRAHLWVEGRWIRLVQWPVFAGLVKACLCHPNGYVNHASGRSQSSQAVNEDMKRCIKEAVQDSVKDLLSTSSRRSRSTHQAVQEDDSPEPGLVSSRSDTDSQGAQDGMDSF